MYNIYFGIRNVYGYPGLGNTIPIYARIFCFKWCHCVGNSYSIFMHQHGNTKKFTIDIILQIVYLPWIIISPIDGRRFSFDTITSIFTGFFIVRPFIILRPGIFRTRYMLYLQNNYIWVIKRLTYSKMSVISIFVIII